MRVQSIGIWLYMYFKYHYYDIQYNNGPKEHANKQNWLIVYVLFYLVLLFLCPDGMTEIGAHVLILDIPEEASESEQAILKAQRISLGYSISLWSALNLTKRVSPTLT